MNAILAAMVNERWQPGIGDPNFWGWVTVFAYFFAFYMCARCVLHTPRFREKFIWLVFTGIMLFLGFNKQLDLQSFFTQALKDLAKEQGWYEQRRAYQVYFIVALSLFGAGFIVVFGGFMLFSFKKFFFPFVGIAFLVFFIVMRAASFHKMDSFLNTKVINIKYNVLIELTGIVFVIFGAKLELINKRLKKVVGTAKDPSG
ncbi:MAG: hypothetical protein COZ46_08040 [Verrucomicrobia bacterium CG_4_10_14_3_um_filter_43_23]|nr:MAG: hypothetical protein AUJ82_05375 [Verrucomicrobia bacterium CG1_02_43_26]PIP58757.1 MAG: hypothetical protein COX01_07015 [Verrucomicrobia bacterium CG22_combo_CG10-13_8_21_14_all_43_17]PIX57604.1 MAG: hypothetical protein COZ46_08040 [Verrucomicrobia bacterium CG_4_10_14_3_um_filter_43_23]PIY61532.1 MAG: hypothetical protein COY94_04990 [Verrucomicrobia bacterium CG_4_10_14_0_8_um_filter_43_34]PJA44400.1 MAG: hypothetical protein CO175_03050 [Verrucomicrobia bacterium CG_4_9_14_3_um_fi